MRRLVEEAYMLVQLQHGHRAESGSHTIIKRDGAWFGQVVNGRPVKFLRGAPRRSRVAPLRRGEFHEMDIGHVEEILEWNWLNLDRWLLSRNLLFRLWLLRVRGKV